MDWQAGTRNVTLMGGQSLSAVIGTHNYSGHMEACIFVVTHASSCTTPADFSGKESVFDLDSALERHPPMPTDTTYPEQGMFAAYQGGSIKEFTFRF
jgi:hypothetical protein